MTARSNPCSNGPIALYVHWPFCVSKCPYCDFNSHVRSDIDQKQWREALLRDLEHEADELPGRTLGSIFFGGGTPSLMDPATVDAVIQKATDIWSNVPDLEITLEANPNSVETARFSDLAIAGVNRISLGVQSFDDESLRFLGRAHSAKEAFRALEVGQNLFRRTSFDLIYALPFDTRSRWSMRLEQALSLRTSHLSLYQLTIEPGTRFATMVAKGMFEPLGSEPAAQLYELTRAMTLDAGLPAYEISNHSVPGNESRHNLTYWRYGEYSGIGPGAHGRRLGMRTVRHRKPENFLSGVARNGHGIVEEELLSPMQAADEALVMGLRLSEGIDVDLIAKRFGVETLVDWERVRRLERSGHIELSGTRIQLSQKGQLLLDYILADIAALDTKVLAVANPQASEAAPKSQQPSVLEQYS